MMHQPKQVFIRLRVGLLGIVLVVALAACDPSLTVTQPPALPTQPNTLPEVPTQVMTVPTQPNTLPEVPTLLPPTVGLLPTSTSPSVGRTPLEQGFGAQKGFWQVFFTAPTGSGNRANYVGGIDTQVADALNQVQRTLDIAAFELNNPTITAAILAAHQRGVTVRMVTDDEHGIESNDTTLGQLTAAGMPVVDDNRSALMHNKFMILDSTTIITGSYNFTINDTYRNNNNMLIFRSQKMVQDYQNQFNKMFELKQFGPTRPSNTPFPSFTQDGAAVQVLFAPEDRVVSALAVALSSATTSIRFMAFSFTLDDIAGVMQQKAQQGVIINGIFETTGSETRTSELTPLLCSGLAMRQDGNPFVMHHKVFIIDDKTVVTGSFNFSTGARDSNDENMLIITDPDLALQYVEEFNRRWADQAANPDHMQLEPSANRWVMRQTWSKLLFAHWPVPPDMLRPLIPPTLEVDTFDGSAWVGVVPFYMSNVRFRYMQPFPTTREFCELNVRTYVMPKGGKAGVWFFSLDASSRLAVQGARTAFHLPYYNAQMQLTLADQQVTYHANRTHRRARPASFEGRYQPTGAVFRSTTGTLEHWLTERYCLYAADGRGRIYQGDIVHEPWPLQPATADLSLNTMAQAAGITLPDTLPLLHYAESLDVQAWYLRRIAVS